MCVLLIELIPVLVNGGLPQFTVEIGVFLLRNVHRSPGPLTSLDRRERPVPLLQSHKQVQHTLTVSRHESVRELVGLLFVIPVYGNGELPMWQR